MEFLCTINCKVFVCKNWSKPFDLSTLIFPVATYIQICRQMSEEQSRTGKNVKRFYIFKWDIICMHTFSRSRVVKFWLKMICVNYKKKIDTLRRWPYHMTLLSEGHQDQKHIRDLCFDLWFFYFLVQGHCTSLIQQHFIL